MCAELYGENYPNYGVSLGNGFVNKYAAAEKSIWVSNSGYLYKNRRDTMFLSFFCVTRYMSTQFMPSSNDCEVTGMWVASVWSTTVGKLAGGGLIC